MELTLTVKRVGHLPGSLGWFYENLQGATLLVSQTSDGRPGVWIKRANGGQQNLIIQHGEEYGRTLGDWFNSDCLEYEITFWGAILSDASREVVRDLVQQAREIFEEEMNAGERFSIKLEKLEAEKGV